MPQFEDLIEVANHSFGKAQNNITRLTEQLERTAYVEPLETFWRSTNFCSEAVYGDQKLQQLGLMAACSAVAIDGRMPKLRPSVETFAEELFARGKEIEDRITTLLPAMGSGTIYASMTNQSHIPSWASRDEAGQLNTDLTIDHFGKTFYVEKSGERHMPNTNGLYHYVIYSPNHPFNNTWALDLTSAAATPEEAQWPETVATFVGGKDVFGWHIPERRLYIGEQTIQALAEAVVTINDDDSAANKLAGYCPPALARLTRTVFEGTGIDLRNSVEGLEAVVGTKPVISHR